ncbi:FAD/FMN-containing dehydrogenase [Fodinibius roseus]|uniref:FAD/FMN-containing dehydrogenase n=1 Tax=Fodinibius roseus TaxID=1194090 RepID=A0A1M4UIA8_9BACT|nr:FAD-binding oxidoreductase [Fodinibius roseus]SHE56300.1 FAD/FMN-containing dehydrogenase [Fodinibius roseus]
MVHQSAIKKFREKLHGSLLFPRDSGYHEARSVWNGRIDRKPMAIARCKDTSDVIASINFARDHQLLVSIRGGGHHAAGHAVSDGGLMIDLSLMNEIYVDPTIKIAKAGPGTSVRDLDHETQKFGLVITGAPVSTVGIAGYTLGGGLGWTSRKHGLACDNLISVDVVTAEGELIHASEDKYPNLFWGIRGGSGNFGVVTSFEFQLHEMGPDVLAGPIVHPIEEAPRLLRFWRDYMLDAPDELQCMPVMFNTPESETVFCLYPLYAGNPAEGESVIKPFREIGTPLSDGIEATSYADLLSELDEMYRSGDRNYYRSAFFDSIPDEAIDTFVEKAAPIPSPFSSIFLEPLGGAIARRDTHATAFPHRERKFCITAVPKWDDENRDEEMMAWADELFNALKPYAADGVYVNYLDEVGDEPARDAYGQHWNRLTELKKKWDPENLFRMNHNVPPAG